MILFSLRQKRYDGSSSLRYFGGYDEARAAYDEAIDSRLYVLVSLGEMRVHGILTEDMIASALSGMQDFLTKNKVTRRTLEHWVEPGRVADWEFSYVLAPPVTTEDVDRYKQTVEVSDSVDLFVDLVPWRVEPATTIIEGKVTETMKLVITLWELTEQEALQRHHNIAILLAQKPGWVEASFRKVPDSES